MRVRVRVCVCEREREREREGGVGKLKFAKQTVYFICLNSCYTLICYDRTGVFLLIVNWVSCLANSVLFRYYQLVLVNTNHVY